MVLDVSRQPGQIQRPVAALSRQSGPCVFVSSGNVYADHSTPGEDEGASLLPALDGDVMESETYGEAKVACEHHVLGAPLYGRFQEMVVPPLTPAETGDMLGLGAAAALDAYLIIGGFPRLATLWRRGESMWKLLERELQNPATPLAVIGERSVNAEFSADVKARNVLAAIGAGERAFSAIEQRAGLPRTSFVRALEVLEEKRVISKAASAPRC